MIIAGWIFVILLSGAIAHNKGRSPFWFGLLAVPLGVFALPFALGARRRQPLTPKPLSHETTVALGWYAAVSFVVALVVVSVVLHYAG